MSLASVTAMRPSPSSLIAVASPQIVLELTFLTSNITDLVRVTLDTDDFLFGLRNYTMLLVL